MLQHFLMSNRNLSDFSLSQAFLIPFVQNRERQALSSLQPSSPSLQTDSMVLSGSLCKRTNLSIFTRSPVFSISDCIHWSLPIHFMPSLEVWSQTGQTILLGILLLLIEETVGETTLTALLFIHPTKLSGFFWSLPHNQFTSTPCPSCLTKFLA